MDCSNGTQCGVAINNGLNSENSGQRAKRRDGGSEKIFYDVYRDSAMIQPWDSDWSGSSILRASNNDRAREFPVYARVPPQGSKAAGIYKDTLIVEVRIME